MLKRVVFGTCIVIMIVLLTNLAMVYVDGAHASPDKGTPNASVPRLDPLVFKDVSDFPIQQVISGPPIYMSQGGVYQVGDPVIVYWDQRCSDPSAGGYTLGLDFSGPYPPPNVRGGCDFIDQGQYLLGYAEQRDVGYQYTITATWTSFCTPPTGGGYQCMWISTEYSQTSFEVVGSTQTCQYGGTYPNCNPPPTCQYGGTYPNCNPPPTCQYGGTYPNCNPPSSCQYGGIYPNCNPPPTCQYGGTYPNCNPAPTCQYGGTYPNCNPPPTCQYGGTYPNCNPPPTCQYGGTYPNCNPPPTCQYGGTYPNCNPPPTCPYGGTYPNCNPPPSCPYGGTYPNCNPPPSCPYGGTYPNCNPPPSCPYGGTYPNCNPPPTCQYGGTYPNCNQPPTSPGQGSSNVESGCQLISGGYNCGLSQNIPLNGGSVQGTLYSGSVQAGQGGYDASATLGQIGASTTINGVDTSFSLTTGSGEIGGNIGAGDTGGTIGASLLHAQAQYDGVGLGLDAAGVGFSLHAGLDKIEVGGAFGIGGTVTFYPGQIANDLTSWWNSATGSTAGSIGSSLQGIVNVFRSRFAISDSLIESTPLVTSADQEHLVSNYGEARGLIAIACVSMSHLSQLRPKDSRTHSENRR